MNNINNITNIIISASSLETKNAELSSKKICDSLPETKFTNNIKDENDISIKIQSTKLNNNNENEFSLSNFKQHHQQNAISISPIGGNISKRLLNEDSKIDFDFMRKNSSTSANLKNERISITNTEDGIMLPVHDFYDEFNREIILTDYFSRFLALSIAIYEDEINESNLANFKNNNVNNLSNSNSNNCISANSQLGQNINLHMNRSNVFNKELEDYDHMRKKANVELTKNEKKDLNNHLNVSNFVPKHRNSTEIQSAENPLFNRQIQYREYNKKNIPERFKSQRIGNLF